MPALLATVWQEAGVPGRRAIQLKTRMSDDARAQRGSRRPSAAPYPTQHAGQAAPQRRQWQFGNIAGAKGKLSCHGARGIEIRFGRIRPAHMGLGRLKAAAEYAFAQCRVARGGVGLGKRDRTAKIDQMHGAGLVDQDVSRMDVAVDNPGAMNNGKRLEQPVIERANHLLACHRPRLEPARMPLNPCIRRQARNILLGQARERLGRKTCIAN